MRLDAANFVTKPADADEDLAAFEMNNGQVLSTAGEARLAPSLAQTEWAHIHRALAECGGILSEAARRLGTHRRSLQRKLKKLAPD